MTYKEFCKNELGYECKTMFWDDFTIADAFGEKGIRDTYKRAFEEWKTNTEYITEFVMVLNHKCNIWYDKGNEEYSRIYQELYEQADAWCMDNLQGDDLNYFLQTTD